MLKQPHFWFQSRHPLSWMLAPFSWLFAFLVVIRRSCYKWGILSQYRCHVPVVVVGNINVGGTGKTPVVIGIAIFLRSKGYHVGIVTRGYKANLEPSLQPFLVEHPEPCAGDEPNLISSKTGCPVVIDKNRSRGVHFLIETCRCDVVISDDGLQHYALVRDVEIVVIDGDRRFGNNRLFPAGPLREPVSRLSEVDFLLSNKPQHIQEYCFEVVPKRFSVLHDPDIIQPVHFFSGRTVHAVSGLGNPKRFSDSLHALEIEVLTHHFPDHYAFAKSDLLFSDQHPVVVTEKDAEKLRFSFEKQKTTLDVWVLETDTLLSATFTQQLLERIVQYYDNRKISVD